MLGDLRNPRWLYAKAVLLLGVGLLASAIVLMDSPTLRTAGLLAIAVWGFCRAYYFAFYVVQQYADPGYRFAGLLSFARYCWGRAEPLGNGAVSSLPPKRKATNHTKRARREMAPIRARFV